jgi:hypothetical protein
VGVTSRWWWGPIWCEVGRGRGSGGPGCDEREGGRVWRAIPSIEPPGLDISGTSVIPPVGGSGGLFEAREPEVEALGGPGCNEREGGPVWRARPNIEPPGLDIGGTSVIAPVGGSGELFEAGEPEVEALGGPGCNEREGGPVWRAKPKLEPAGLDIGGTGRIPPGDGSEDTCGAGEPEVEGWGALEPVCAWVGGFGARNRISSPLGSISVGPAGFRLLTAAGGCVKRGRTSLKGWGA